MKNSDLVVRFSKRLWDLRLQLAQSIISPIPDHDKITTAQRILDRFMFLYFIASNGIISEIKETRSEYGSNIRLLFTQLAQNSTEFYATLNKIFYKYLNSPDKNNMPLEGEKNLALHIPHVSGNLFPERIFPSPHGQIKESELTIEGFDWSQLIAGLNKYNWVIDSSHAAGPNEVTPSILGHIYEKFVVAMSRIREIDNLEHLRTTSKGQIRKGKKKIGTHYTPPDITDYIARNTILPYTVDQIGKSEYTSFDGFIEEHQDDPEMLEAFTNKLQQIRVLDPAVGSGHFLLAAANLLLKWWKESGDETPEYQLRRDIITNNLFGVDIMDGAVEICKLRLWLWLLAAQKNDQDPKPLPNLNYNIKTGNSLIGLSREETPDELRDILQEYAEEVKRHRANQQEHLGLHEDIRALYSRIRNQLDEIYLKGTNDRLAVEFKNLEDAQEGFAAGCDPRATLSLKFGRSMSEDTKRRLDSLGFTTWKKTAKLKVNLEDFDGKHLKEIRDAIGKGEDTDSIIIIERLPTIEDLEQINPFHWMLEFPRVFEEKSGFDVVIGNPPYGDLLSPAEKAFMSSRYRTAGYNEISANFIERQIEILLREGGYFGNITTSSILANSTMHELHTVIREKLTDVCTSVFARRPSKVFRNAEINVAITTGRKTEHANGSWKTSDFIRFREDEQDGLMENIEYGDIDGLVLRDRIGGKRDADKFEVIPKVGDPVKESILRKLASKDRTIGDCLGDGEYRLYFRRAANYWMNVSIEKPAGATNMKLMRFKNELERDFSFLVLNSSLFYLYWMTYCNMHDVTRSQIRKFPVPGISELQRHKDAISSLSKSLSEEITKQYRPGTYHQFRMQPAKPLIDDIENLLIGPIYNLKHKQISHSVDYQSKYRL
ncbi:MAG: hypothetical protein GF309_12660 [Candidatus Lokiarchaeota archaeon]|nr:hypothetical protein [Candidatus Lokiarchaeota archaeon]